MMKFCCFYSGLPKNSPNKEHKFTLSKEESHHLVNVLRAQVGDQVTLFSADNCFCEGNVTEIRKHAAVVTAGNIKAVTRQYPEITLAVAIPKGKTMESIIRKATEIGATRIIPLQTERTEVQLNAERKENKGQRWEHTAIESCKQSGNLCIPQITEIQTFKHYIESLSASISDNEVCLMGSLEANSVPLKNTLQKLDFKNLKQLIFLIGPEGDFTPSEYEMARSVNVLPVRLAKNVLRVETAALYALAALDYERQAL